MKTQSRKKKRQKRAKRQREDVENERWLNINLKSTLQKMEFGNYGMWTYGDFNS